MIGRQRERRFLERCLESEQPEFLVLYGRRRVGKTFLIKEFFNDQFSFYATGVPSENTRSQLKTFNLSLRRYGCSERNIPRDWLEAFDRVRTVLEDEHVQRTSLSGKRVVFLDEVPWMDTARSDFKMALDYFWNSWGSSQHDLLLIICGSATSWMIDHILSDHGGFYNRTTRQIHLLPFTLCECEEFLKNRNIPFTRMQIMECYMVFGGIPYYLNSLEGHLSLAQNIDALCFKESSPFRHEFDRLFHSLFRNPGRHMAIIRCLNERKSGITRGELASNPEIGDGECLTKALRELEQCGFIRKYNDFTKSKYHSFYQLIDPFVLFSIKFLEAGNTSSWNAFVNTPGYYSWCGNAFEILCLNHIRQIKQAMGIAGVESSEYAWRSKTEGTNVQIDLLIDRNDGVINLCEEKYTRDPFVIDAAYEQHLIHRMNLFQQETGTKKALHLTMITASGLHRNAHAGMIQRSISSDSLFAPTWEEP